MFFEDKNIRHARKFFNKREKVLKRFLDEKIDIDNDIFVGELKQNNILVLTTLDPNAPVDSFNVSEKKVNLINKFILMVNDKIIEEYKKKNVAYIPHDKVLKLIKNDKWAAKKHKDIISNFDEMYSSFCHEFKYKDKYIDYDFTKLKGNSILKTPIDACALCFLNTEHLKVRLFHCISLTKDVPLDWNRLYMLLCIQDKLEDYTNNLINIR